MKFFGLNVVLVCVAQEVAWIMCFLLLVLMVPIVCACWASVLYFGYCVTWLCSRHMHDVSVVLRCASGPNCHGCTPMNADTAPTVGASSVYTLFSLKLLYQSRPQRRSASDRS